MAKIHDWQRIYWRNASGDREFFRRTTVDDLDEEEQEEYEQVVQENDRALYQNENGDVVGYRRSEEPEPVEPPEDADEDAEPQLPDDWHGMKYEVFFDPAGEGERSLLEAVDFSDNDPQGWVDEEAERPAEVELSAFSTRGDARKFTAAWRAAHGSPEDLGYFQYDEDELPEDYDELQDLAAEHEIRRNQSEEQLRAQLSGEEEPVYTNDHARIEA